MVGQFIKNLAARHCLDRMGFAWFVIGMYIGVQFATKYDLNKCNLLINHLIKNKETTKEDPFQTFKKILKSAEKNQKKDKEE